MTVVSKYFPGLSPQQLAQFAALKDLYTDWNQKINVISRKDMDNFYEHHVLHSLAIAKIFSFPVGHKIIDIGSGGGFPGIPLAIFFPAAHFYLVDSIKKKMTVAAEVAKAIGLSNVSTHHMRAEEMPKQQFDIVLSRAVAPLKDLWLWSKPLIKHPVSGDESPTGLICLKGGDLNNEISESGCRPYTYPINTIFTEEFFKEKYVLYVKS